MRNPSVLTYFENNWAGKHSTVINAMEGNKVNVEKLRDAIKSLIRINDKYKLGWVNSLNKFMLTLDVVYSHPIKPAAYLEKINNFDRSCFDLLRAFGVLSMNLYNKRTEKKLKSYLTTTPEINRNIQTLGYEIETGDIIDYLVDGSLEQKVDSLHDKLPIIENICSCKFNNCFNADADFFNLLVSLSAPVNAPNKSTLSSAFNYNNFNLLKKLEEHDIVKYICQDGTKKGVYQFISLDISSSEKKSTKDIIKSILANQLNTCVYKGVSYDSLLARLNFELNTFDIKAPNFINESKYSHLKNRLDSALKSLKESKEIESVKYSCLPEMYYIAGKQPILLNDNIYSWDAMLVGGAAIVYGDSIPEKLKGVSVGDLTKWAAEFVYYIPFRTCQMENEHLATIKLFSKSIMEILLSSHNCTANVKTLKSYIGVKEDENSLFSITIYNLIKQKYIKAMSTGYKDLIGENDNTIYTISNFPLNEDFSLLPPCCMSNNLSIPLKDIEIPSKNMTEATDFNEDIDDFIDEFTEEASHSSSAEVENNTNNEVVETESTQEKIETPIDTNFDTKLENALSDMCNFCEKYFHNHIHSVALKDSINTLKQRVPDNTSNLIWAGVHSGLLRILDFWGIISYELGENNAKVYNFSLDNVRSYTETEKVYKKAVNSGTLRLLETLYDKEEISYYKNILCVLKLFNAPVGKTQMTLVSGVPLNISVRIINDLVKLGIITEKYERGAAYYTLASEDKKNKVISDFVENNKLENNIKNNILGLLEQHESTSFKKGIEINVGMILNFEGNKIDSENVIPKDTLLKYLKDEIDKLLNEKEINKLSLFLDKKQVNYYYLTGRQHDIINNSYSIDFMTDNASIYLSGIRAPEEIFKGSEIDEDFNKEKTINAWAANYLYSKAFMDDKNFLDINISEKIYKYMKGIVENIEYDSKKDKIEYVDLTEYINKINLHNPEKINLIRAACYNLIVQGYIKCFVKDMKYTDYLGITNCSYKLIKKHLSSSNFKIIYPYYLKDDKVELIYDEKKEPVIILPHLPEEPVINKEEIMKEEVKKLSFMDKLKILFK